MRIGHGFDAHRFGDGDKVILGGVSIAHDKGLQAHSDGDVLLHALCDALLGAAGLGDIGRHFPDTSAEYENIDSRILLRHVMQELSSRHWGVANCDMTLVAQQPRLAQHVPAMCNNIATDLGIKPDCVNVKATTTEGMGYTGRAEGIAAHAVVLLVKTDV
ncbi:MAG: 2-C-methyl-D-erythritol 2,4-cyclodiphosphate synthase [Gammaproteobacteria bacterium]|nr:2-C-methyl-D-erythritol 2,4-cyclodiphosphate synthase [Gammaproteobacteria bacterium]MDH5803345.1 2-C-methyl-D-erythritol 2,4-cyclodiphosphate synthase [Gammaproteobacteria bacterium]